MICSSEKTKKARSVDRTFLLICNFSSLLVLGSGFGPINTLQREEFEIVILVKPGALEVLQRQIASATQRERVDRKLDVRVLFFSRFGLVVEKVDVAVPYL